MKGGGFPPAKFGEQTFSRAFPVPARGPSGSSRGPEPGRPVARSRAPLPLSRGSCKLLHCGAGRRRASPGRGRGGGRSYGQGCLRRPPGLSYPLAPGHPAAWSFSRTVSLTWGRQLAARREPRRAAAVNGCRRRGAKGPETKPRCRRRRRFGELSSQPIAREAGDVRQPPPGLRATPQAPTPPSYPQHLVLAEPASATHVPGSLLIPCSGAEQ